MSLRAGHIFRQRKCISSENSGVFWSCVEMLALILLHGLDVTQLCTSNLAFLLCCPSVCRIIDQAQAVGGRIFNDVPLV